MITEKAYAKLNLCLSVGGRLPNGYHTVKSLMQTVSLYDSVSLAPAKEISLSCVGQELSCGEDNLAHRAAVAFFEYSGISGGVSIGLEKRIPRGAGLGGGSADGAAVLRGLNKLYGTRYGTEELCNIGSALGADVPFCVMGGSAVATHVGTVLKPATHNVLNFVLLFGKESLSTPEMYRALDSGENCYPSADDFLKLWAQGVPYAAFGYGGNSFYPLAALRDSTVDANVKALKAAGAVYASISGKGPTVFGVFKELSAAQSAAKALGGIAVNSVIIE